jgi:hypothetical protein
LGQPRLSTSTGIVEVISSPRLPCQEISDHSTRATRREGKAVIDLILRDSQSHPGAFIWRGPLVLSAIEDWERSKSIYVPEDLKKLWCLMGGGDLFDDSETILQPFGSEEYDLIEPVSSVLWTEGLSPDYYVFHKGIVDSVFRKYDGALFSLAPSDLAHMPQYRDLDDWYMKTLRPVYAEQYSLETLA